MADAADDGASPDMRRAGLLRVALYGVLFEARPQDAVARVGEMLCARPDRDKVLAAIRRELTSPDHELRELLPGMPSSEGDLREFLVLLQEELERR